MADRDHLTDNVKTIGALVEYLSAFDPETRLTCDLLDQAKTLIVVDSEGNASVHKVEPKRTLIVYANLPITSS